MPNFEAFTTWLAPSAKEPYVTIQKARDHLA